MAWLTLYSLLCSFPYQLEAHYIDVIDYGVKIVNVFWLHCWDKIDAMIISDCRDNQLRKVTILDITPLFRAWFIKQQNNWRDGIKVVHGVMAWLALFQGVICKTAK